MGTDGDRQLLLIGGGTDELGSAHSDVYAGIVDRGGLGGPVRDRLAGGLTA